MPTALSVLRQRMSEAILDWEELATSSAGNAGGTTLVDAGLADLPNGGDDDFCEGMFVRLPDGATGSGSAEVRKVASYDAATTTITLERAASAQIATSNTYELHRYEPRHKDAALNTVLRQAYPDIYIPVMDETLVTDQLLSNGDFESALSGGNHPNWTRANHTAALETVRVWHGANSAEIAASGGVGTLTQDLFTSVNIHEIAGKTLIFEGRTWASVADVARLRITFDGSTYTNGSYHRGQNEWEGPGRTYVQAAVPTDATEMTVVCSVADGNTAYFDAMVARIDRISRYTVPTAIDLGPHEVLVQADPTRQDAPYNPVPHYHTDPSGATRYLWLDSALPGGRRLRLKGRGTLTALSADTDTTEVEGAQTDFVAHLSAYELFGRLAAEASGQDEGFYSNMSLHHKAKAEELRPRPGVLMRTGAQLHYRAVRN